MVNRLDLHLTDADLARALKERHPEAPSAAVRRFSPIVRGVLRRALGAHDDLEDAQQEVFSSLFRGIEALRDPLSLRPYVIGIALHTASCERRRRRRRASLTSAAERCAVRSVPDSARAKYAFARLERLVRRLGKRERATFVLRFIEGKTVAEVAEVLRVSQSTARRSLSRAQERVNGWAARDPFLLDYLEGEAGTERRAASEHANQS